MISEHATFSLLQKLEDKNSFETQRTLAVEMNLPVQSYEKLKPQQDASVRIELTLSAEQFAELEKAKSLLSHICPDGTWAEVIATLAKRFNQQKLEGRNKSARSVIASKVKSGSETEAINSSVRPPSTKGERNYISVMTKRFLLKRANHRCEFHDSSTNKRCASQYQLQVDHIHPVALGGDERIENLRVLCRTHNNFAARRRGLITGTHFQ